MRFLAELEQRLEGTLQRLFPRRRGKGAEPLDVARLLTQAMESRRQVSVDAVYVPNHFEVFLSPADLDRLQQIERTLERDAVRHVERTAAARGFEFAGPIELRFTADPQLAPGELRVEASFREALGEREADEMARGGASPADEPQQDEPTRRFPAVRGAAGAGARLVVASGPLEGEVFVLSKEKPFLIGRHPGADLHLPDPKVSRRHALVRWEEGSWRLTDQGSTNGTLHNGRRVAEATLSDGDEVVVGLTALRFRQG